MLNKIKIIFHLVYLIFFFSCSISPKKEPSPYRFIDQLDRKNVISSPLIGLYKKFNRIDQKWLGKELKTLTINEQKYLAISTQFPVVGWEHQAKPEKMKISLEGKEIPFQEDSSPSVFSWRLKKGEIEIEAFNRNIKKRKIYLLNEKKRLKEDIILPDGEFILEIWAKSQDPLTHIPRLKIILNDRSIGEIPIGPYKCYKITGQAKLGWNKLEFLIEKSIKNKEQSESELSIRKISIKSLSDIILFTTEENKKNFLTSKFSAEYLAEPIDKIYKIERNIESFQSLTQEIEFDSSGKNKIEIIGYSPNVKSFLYTKLNGQKIHKAKVTSIYQNIFSIEKKRKKGKYDLELEYLSPYQEGGNFYLSDIIIKNPMRETYLKLAKIEKISLIHDLSIGRNPLGLKKKLVVFSSPNQKLIHNAINTIFAPPLTHFEFSLKIPQSATLEFGYGLLERSWKKKDNGVNFKIIIQNKKKNEIIFLKQLNPYQNKSHRKLFQERIDLSPYSNKKVKLKFTTFSSSFKPESLHIKPHVAKEFAYWYNPVIYVSSEKEKKPKPGINIILVSLDTLRADHLKCYGYKRETSPNIDRLGTEGVVFINTFSTTCWTLPAHISLLTSLENRHHLVNTRNSHLDNSIITLADILRENGYFTYGYTGGGLVSQRFGFSKGFDFYREFRGSQRHKNSAEILYNNFEEWLDKNKDKKFFLFLHTYQTHQPYFSPSPFNSLFFHNRKAKWDEANMLRILYDDKLKHANQFKNLTSSEKENIVALYDGEIRYTDECLIKLLIEKLKKLDLYQRTMIIVTSDHGEEFFEHRGWLHGQSLYNELIRIPLVIKFPFSKYKNSKIDKCVRITDIMPTILQEAGIDYSSFEFDGESLIKIIRNNEKNARICTADLGTDNYPLELPSKIALIFNTFKLILNTEFEHPPKHFVHYPLPEAKFELYDLRKDSLDKKNIANQEKEVVQDLLKKIYELYPTGPEKRGQKKEKETDKELEETLRALGYIK